MYKQKNLKYFMKFGSNGKNKAQKQMFEAKTVKETNLQFTGSGLWPVFT